MMAANGHGKGPTNVFARLLAGEAAAYVRSGLLAPGGTRSVRQNRARAEFGVVFVPGLGANASQFSALKLRLGDVCEWFDAFDYTLSAHPEKIARNLRDHLDEAGTRCSRLLVVGHSFGGVLIRTTLQSEDAPRSVAGWASICSPLHGTWRSRFALNPGLRALAPDGPFVRGLCDRAHHLERLRGSILTIGSRHDHFIAPYDSAFIDGAERLCLDDAGHVASLFDPRVHDAVVALAKRLGPARK